MAGVYRHSHENLTSIINMLENPLRPGWETTLFVLNGRNIEDIMTQLKNIFPPQEKSITDLLPSILTKVEFDEHLVLSAPTFHHSLDPDQFLFNTKLKNEVIRRPNDD